MLEQTEIAKRVLCNIFNVRESDIVFMRSREYKINEARRFFIYYLFWHKKVKHYHMKEHIFGIHHATSMHHVNRMRELLTNYSDIRERVGRDGKPFLIITRETTFKNQNDAILCITRASTIRR